MSSNILYCYNNNSRPLGRPIFIININDTNQFKPKPSKREKKLLNDLSTKVNIVISTGGGIITDEDNREILKKFSTVFFLMCEPQTSLKRTKNDHNRPLLLNTNRLEKLEELYKERKYAYSNTAHHIIDVDKMTSKVAINQILTILKNGQS